MAWLSRLAPSSWAKVAPTGKKVRARNRSLIVSFIIILQCRISLHTLWFRLGLPSAARATLAGMHAPPHLNDKFPAQNRILDFGPITGGDPVAGWDWALPHFSAKKKPTPVEKGSAKQSKRCLFSLHAWIISFRNRTVYQTLVQYRAGEGEVIMVLRLYGTKPKHLLTTDFKEKVDANQNSQTRYAHHRGSCTLCWPTRQSRGKKSGRGTRLTDSLLNFRPSSFSHITNQSLSL